MKIRMGMVSRALEKLPITEENLYLLLYFIEHEIAPIRETVYAALADGFKEKFPEALDALQNSVEKESNQKLKKMLDEILTPDG